MSDPADRRYSEREFALILRKASELQLDDSEATAPTEGLSLEEIQQIADEAGIDPTLVARAAALIGHGDIAEDERSFWGPSATVHISSSVEGELSEDDMRRLMDVVRYRVAKTGTIHEVLGSVAWKADGEETPFEIRVTPRDGRTTVEILNRTQAYKTLTYVMGGTIGFLAALMVLAGLGVPKAVVLVGAFLAAPFLGVLAARPFWRWWARRWRNSLTDLLDTLRDEAERRAASLPERSQDRSLPPGGDAPDPVW